ncbi:MAG: M56 family metallopeptidase [Flavobacteriaceae bacterium]|nr:M56 family metallopeptidase [Flavobacteriaceae bacterium]
METLIYILKSAGVITLFYGVYSTLLKKETLFSANRHFLLLGILGAFLFPLLQFTRTVVKEIPAIESSLWEETLNDSTPSEVTALITQTSFSWFTFDYVLMTVYVTGFIFFFGRFAFQLIKLLKWLAQYPSERKNGFHIIEVNETIVPFSFFNYIVYNPTMHTASELEMILQHEKVHAQQSHSIDVLVSHILTAVQWFNPLAWLYKKSIEENLEFMADYYTIHKVPSKKAYQLALVKASSATNMPALTNYFYQSFIKKRIIMLNKHHSKKRNALKATFILPLLALFLWSFNVKDVTEWVTIPSEDTSVEPTILKENPKETLLLDSSEITEEIPSEITQGRIAEEEDLAIKNTPISEEYRVKITKNTTDSELQKIKKELQEKFGIDLSYTTIRNDAKEIVSLSMNYSGNGNNGNYQVTDDKGIEDFHFYIDDEGKSGFWSEATEERRIERVEKRRETMEKRLEEMEELREKRMEEMEERREEMEVKRKEMDKLREEMDVKRITIDKRRNEINEKRAKEIIIVSEDLNDIDEIEEIEELDEGGGYVLSRSGRGDNTVAVVSKGKSGMSITKSTTDAQLAKMKEDLAQKNITFSYKNVKRNAQGEITGIKFSLDDHKGSKSTTVVKGDENEPISVIFLRH